MADPETSNSSLEEDRDFNPSADMLIHEYDDEQTLDDEEALSNEESVANEIDDLQREGEMPMEELLAMYGYRKTIHPTVTDFLPATSSTGKSHDSDQSHPLPQVLGKSLVSKEEALEEDGVEEENNEEGEKNNSTLDDLIANSGLLGDGLDLPSDEDDDYEPDLEDWKKTVQVGFDYQAVIPEVSSTANHVNANDNEDRILWSPDSISEKEVLMFLLEVKKLNDASFNAVSSSASSVSSIRDDEQALYLLLQCDNNKDEALRRHKLQNHPPPDAMSLWSEEECRNFEAGLRAYGKDFFLNQQNKVKTRSVREIVQFYYLWKKTERHDAFAARTRQEKKKYALHPGITDYMDRFIDEYETATLEGHFEHASTSPKLLLSSKNDLKSALYAHAADMGSLLMPPFNAASCKSYLGDKDLRYEPKFSSELELPLEMHANLPTSELNFHQVATHQEMTNSTLALDIGVCEDVTFVDGLLGAQGDISSTNNQLHFPHFDTNGQLHRFVNLDAHLDENYASLVTDAPLVHLTHSTQPTSINNISSSSCPLDSITMLSKEQLEPDDCLAVHTVVGLEGSDNTSKESNSYMTKSDETDAFNSETAIKISTTCRKENKPVISNIPDSNSFLLDVCHVDNDLSQENKLRLNDKETVKTNFSSTQNFADSTISL